MPIPKGNLERRTNGVATPIMVPFEDSLYFDQSRRGKEVKVIKIYNASTGRYNYSSYGPPLNNFEIEFTESNGKKIDYRRRK